LGTNAEWKSLIRAALRWCSPSARDCSQRVLFPGHAEELFAPFTGDADQREDRRHLDLGRFESSGEDSRHPGFGPAQLFGESFAAEVGALHSHSQGIADLAAAHGRPSFDHGDLLIIFARRNIERPHDNPKAFPGNYP
jgi:hypothetical protein